LTKLPIELNGLYMLNDDQNQQKLYKII
jgi:hypothetical protein